MDYGGARCYRITNPPIRQPGRAAMTRLLVIALAVTLILAGCTPEPRSHAPTIYQLQNVVDQGVSVQ